MFLLGLILIVLGAGLGLLSYLAATPSSQTIELSAFGFNRLSGPVELLLVGALSALLVCLGWAAITSTTRRRARLRREEKEQERVAALERQVAETRTEQERRLEEAQLRDEDFTRRDEELNTRHAELETRERELARREAEWREREGPSVADVVTGRAEGRVTEGTATWADDDSTRPLDTPRADDPRRTDGV